MNLSKVKSLHLLLVALVVSFGLQVATIAKWSVWHDEGYTAMLVDYQPSELVRRTGLDVHPPLYYLLLKGWGNVVGHTDVRLRLFSVIFMVATLAVTFLLIRRLFGDRAARWSLLPLVLGPVLVRYGQEMRMYSLAAFVGASATYLLTRLLLDWKTIGSTRKRAYIALYVLLAAALPYIHYFSALLLAVHVAMVFAHYHDTSPLKQSFKARFLAVLKGYKWWVGGMTAVVVIFLPWLGHFIEQSQAVSSGFWIGPVSVQSFVSTLASFVTFRPVWREWRLEGWYAVMALGLLVLLAFYLKEFLKVTKTSLQRYVVLGYFMIPAVILFIISLPPRTPVYYDRYMVTFAPMFYGGIGVVLHALWQRRQELKARVLAVVMSGSLVGGLVVASVYGNNFGLTPAYYFHTKQLVARWQPYYASGDTVVVQEVWQYFNAYFYTKDISGEPKLFERGHLNKYGNSSLLYDRQDLLVSNLATLKPATHKVWVFRSTDKDFSADIPATWTKTVTLTDGETTVEGYSILN